MKNRKKVEASSLARFSGLRRKREHTISRHECNALCKLKRRRHHRYVHSIHKKRKISYRTLFYMKEYGPKSHVATVIVKESFKILILASILSSLGGMHVRQVQSEIILFLPLLILLPALTTMIGSFGTIASSKFTTMLYLGKIKKSVWRSKDARDLVHTLAAISLIAAAYISVLAYAVAALRGTAFATAEFAKVLAISLIATASLVVVIIAISVCGGIYIFRRKEDPNNFLIPISTSVADFGSLALFAFLVGVFF